MRIRDRKPRFAGAGASAEREFVRQRRENVREAWRMWLLTFLGVLGFLVWSLFR